MRPITGDRFEATVETSRSAASGKFTYLVGVAGIGRRVNQYRKGQQDAFAALSAMSRALAEDDD